MNSQNKMVYMQKILNPSHYRSNGLTTLTRENFGRIMTESINKAINSDEVAVKSKHVRKLLIGSHQAQSGAFFWEYLPIIKLKENQIICWKFCYVLHKMLRDGHKQVVASAYEKRQILLDCGNMWRHVDGYGPLIHKYCTLVFNRINFLTRNPNFPNDLKLSDEQLDEMGAADPSIFFDLSCEIFDSLDDILNLQKEVREVVVGKNINSMSDPGICRLSPMVLCIQDSTLFYDYSVKILFKLHGSLPASTLEGHRTRFLKLHEAVRSFYVDSYNLQYFRTFIEIPMLSKKAPNFLNASDLQQHVTPKAVMMLDRLGRVSPEPLLVDLDDFSGSAQANHLDDSQSNVSSYATHHTDTSSSSFNAMAELPPEPPLSIDSIFDQSNSTLGGGGGGGDSLSPTSSSIQTHPKQLEHSKMFVDPAAPAPPDYKDDKIHELELSLGQLRGELDRERSEHEKSKSGLQDELKKVRRELSEAKHQLVAARNAYDKLLCECERAKHDNDISQSAMKKLAKEMNDLKGKQQVSEQQLQLRLEVMDTKEKEAQEERQRQRQRELEEEEEEQQQRQRRRREKEMEEEEEARRSLKLLAEANKREEDLLVAEMNEIDKIIREAASKIEELSEKSRKIETGIKLQVNEKISEVCTNLMMAVRNLIAQSRILQREIVGPMNDVSRRSRDDFYKRNSSWTDGLISAAQEVAMAAKALVEAADRSMSGSARFSELAAAAHQVATATTQLVVASRVKANKDSEKLRNLTNAAKQVNQCTSNVVEASKVCAQLIEQQDTDKTMVDISSLSLHQTKKLEMESQVRLLELEEQLSRERFRLGLLRRQHYEQEEAQEVVVVASSGGGGAGAGAGAGDAANTSKQ